MLNFPIHSLPFAWAYNGYDDVVGSSDINVSISFGVFSAMRQIGGYTCIRVRLHSVAGVSLILQAPTLQKKKSLGVFRRKKVSTHFNHVTQTIFNFAGLLSLYEAYR